ncbi:hypothetical protein V8G54_033125 [Vigna mungo]|uniref:Uncharacterized protein n=1 Tax=Vigna mungo TaxID=3915 RepID=A0AAQ3MMS6_VIGMU
MALQTHSTTLAVDTKISPMQKSTVELIQAIGTGMTTQTTTVNVSFITVALSMVMATEATSRVALIPPQITITDIFLHLLFAAQYGLLSCFNITNKCKGFPVIPKPYYVVIVVVNNKDL